MSTLASSTSEWNAKAGTASCIPKSTYANINRDKLCVISVRVPKSGSSAVVESTTCTPTAQTFAYDGTAITAVAQVVNGSVVWQPYLASWESNNNIQAFKLNGGSLTALPAPLAGQGTILGHAAADAPIDFSFANGQVTVTLTNFVAYDVVVLAY